MGDSILAGVLGGLGLFLLGGRLAGGGIGSAFGGWIRERLPQWSETARGSWLSGLGLTAALGWSPSLGANAPALVRRWGLPLERCAFFLGGSALALALIPILAWLEGLGSAVRALAASALGGALLLSLARPRLAALGEGIAGHALVLLGLAVLGDGLAALPQGASLPEARGSLVLLPLALLAGAALGIGIGAPATIALAVQAAAAGSASAHTAAVCLLGAVASLPWLTARVGRLGDPADGVAAAVHAALALASVVCACLLLSWDARFPAILGSAPGGARIALFAFLCASLVPAALLTVVVARPLEAFVLGRLNATRPASRLPYTLEPIRQGVPLLAVESLGASVDAGVAELREVARAKLGGAVLSESRAELARDVVGQVTLAADAFGSGLAAVRWPGKEVATALLAARTAGACGRLLERLLALPPARAPAAGDEAVRRGVALATARAGNLIEFSTRQDELPLVEDLRASRDALDVELLELATRAGWAEPGLVEHLASLRAIARDALELAESRAAEADGEPPPAAPGAPEPPAASPAADPPAALPARRQRIRSVA